MQVGASQTDSTIAFLGVPTERMHTGELQACMVLSTVVVSVWHCCTETHVVPEKKACLFMRMYTSKHLRECALTFRKTRLRVLRIEIIQWDFIFVGLIVVALVDIGVFVMGVLLAGILDLVAVVVVPCVSVNVHLQSSDLFTDQSAFRDVYTCYLSSSVY